MSDNRKSVDIHSIKSIYITICFNEVILATATGFVVSFENNYYLITNRHVVTGRNNETGECLNKDGAIPNKIKIWLPFKTSDGIIWHEYAINLIDENENILWIEHPVFKEKIDVVGIKLNDYNQVDYSYGIKANYKPTVTNKVYIIGYPFGFNVSVNGKFAIWTTGSIASDPDLNLNINGNELPVFLVDAKTRQGQSGSPVIYYNSSGLDLRENGIAINSGAVMHEIGIYSGRINKDSDLGYVWKWSLIKDIIDGSK